MAIKWPWSKKESLKSMEELREEYNRLGALFNPENGQPSPLSVREFQEALKDAQNNSNSDYKSAAAYSAIYTRVAESRKKLIREVDKMRSFYLVDVILNHISEDALSPEISTGKILNASCQREDIQKEIDHLDEKFGFDQIVSCITPDLLANGEYTLGTKVNPKPGAEIPEPQKGEGLNESDTPNTNYGLLEITDNVDQADVIALTKYNDIMGFLVNDPKTKRVVKKHPADYIKFSLSAQKVRLDIFQEFSITQATLSGDLNGLPRYVRTGKSLIAPLIPKLKELELLEAMVPATKLSKLSAGTIIGVQVPASYSVEQAIEASKKVESLLNKKLAVDGRNGEISIENIMGTAGKMKAVPIFGDKGQLSKLDYKSDEPDDLLRSVDDIRRVILTSAGIPYEIVFDSDGTGGKGEILKKYARYLRKLKAVQKAIEDGVRQIIYIHLANKGIKFITTEIKVEFYNKLVEIDNLDKLEFMDTTISMLDNLKKFILDLANPETNPVFHDRVRVDGLVEFLNEQLNVVGFNDILITDNLPEQPKGLPVSGVKKPLTNLPVLPVNKEKIT